MRKIYVLFAFLSIAWVNAQVGINEDQPKATLDVVGEPNVVETMDGIIAPRITGDQLQNKTYTSQQTGAFVYVTTGASEETNENPQTVNVNREGYYYFDGVTWVKIQRGNKTRTKAQLNNLDYYNNVSEGDLVYVSAVSDLPNPIDEVSNITTKGYYFFNSEGEWEDISGENSKSDAVYSASNEFNDNLLSLDIDPTNQFDQIDLSLLNAKFGDNNIQEGYYVAPSSGYYHVTYDLQLKGGVDISALGNNRIWLVKNPQASQPEIERKLIDAIRLFIDVPLVPEITIASIPVTSTTLSTLIRLEEGETLAFGTDPTTLDLDILTSSRVTINIHKVAD